MRPSSLMSDKGDVTAPVLVTIALTDTDDPTRTKTKTVEFDPAEWSFMSETARADAIIGHARAFRREAFRVSYEFASEHSLDDPVEG